MAESILISWGAFLMVSWLVFTVVNGLRRWHQQRVLGQFQAKLLDRIGSVNELGAFLNTEAGDRFLKGLTTIGDAEVSASTRILRAIQAGAVLATVGSGLYLYGWFTPRLPYQATNAINLVATILFAIGAGLLGSAFVSYRLSRQMGVFPFTQQQHESSPSAL